ncbi:MAG: hypothetical protein Q8S01_06130 [Ignavibacteria bacterium]|nr:hypothetical protein [Ignavibacteria bacterium]
MKYYIKLEKKMKYFLKHFSILFISLFALTCNTGGVVDNPPPFLELIDGPQESEVLTKDKVVFVWRGNGSGYTFKYRLLSLDSDNFPSVYQDWTNYSTVTDITYSNLDEGKFRFEIQAKSGSLEPAPLKREFFIDAIKGPSLMFFKTKTNVTVGKLDSVGIWMEDINGLAGFSIVVAFDNSRLNLVSASSGSYVVQKRFQQLTVPNLNDTTYVLKSVNQTGKIEITSAFLTDLGSFPNKSISGSGKILNLVFKGIAKGTTNLEITSIDLRDEKGVVISYNAPKSGIIEVQ